MKEKRSFPRHCGCRIMLAISMVIMLFAPTGSCWAQKSTPAPSVVKSLQTGGSELLSFQGVERLAVSDPSIFDYVVISAAQVMLVAKKQGEGDLYVWDKNGQHTLHILVIPPPSRMPEIITRISQALARPAITISEYNGVVILEGEVENADESKRAEVIAKAYAPKVENLVRVTGMVNSDWSLKNAGPPIEKSLQIGGSELLDFHGIDRVTVADPSVIDYVNLSAIQMIVVGKKAGETNLYVWDRTGPHPFHIIVTPPPSKIPETIARIKEAIARPAISVTEHNEVVILEGEVADTAEIARAEVIAKAYVPKVMNLIHVPNTPPKPAVDVAEIQRVLGPNIKVSMLSEGVLTLEGEATPEQKARMTQVLQALGPRVAVVDLVTAFEPRQILVRVKAVEINKSALKELGVEWGGLTDGVAHDQPILFGEASEGPFDLDEFGPFKRLEGISARLKALITTNKARILAEPNLLVVEGQMAQILVGGEIPIPVVQTSGSNVGAVSVEWKEFGVKLSIKGIIASDNQNINLDVEPEVSNLDFGNAVVVGGIRLPALMTRRVHSVLHIRDRQTLVIGGLYQVEKSKTQRKIPLLGDIPILGELFKRNDKLERETELVVFVTPEIVTEASSAARTADALRKMGEEANGNTDKH